MSRLPTIKVNDFNKDQQAMFEAISTGKRASGAGTGPFVTAEGGLRGPFHPWTYRPVLGNVAQRLGECIRYEGILTDRQREIAILCAAARWRAGYEWIAHSRIARDCGVADDTIQAIFERRQPELEDPSEQVVCEVIKTALDQGGLPDSLYQRSVRLLGQERLVELIMLAGYYTLVSLTLNVFQVPLQEGETPPFQ